MVKQEQQVKDREDHKPQTFIALSIRRNFQKVVGNSIMCNGIPIDTI